MKRIGQMASQVEGLIEEGEAFRRLGGDAGAASRSYGARRGHSFHLGISIAFLAAALVGFAPTYYLKGLTHAPPLGPALHVHGAVFTAWLLLLVVQNALVTVRRVGLHRRLGILGAVLAAVMVPLGIMTAIGAARSGVSRGALEPHVFVVFPLGQMVLFAVFIGAALWNRRRPEVHRRLVLLATTCLMTPALARWPLVDQRPIVALALSASFVVAGIVHDRRSVGRVHPVYLAGLFAILVSGPVRFGLAQTEAWQSLARWLVG